MYNKNYNSNLIFLSVTIFSMASMLMSCGNKDKTSNYVHPSSKPKVEDNHISRRNQPDPSGKQENLNALKGKDLDGNSILNKLLENNLHLSSQSVSELNYSGSLVLLSNDNQLLTLSRDLSDKMSHITKFTLDSNNLGAEGIASLLPALQSMTNLRTLSLDSNNLDSKDIKTICSNNEIHFNKPLNIKFGKKNYKCQKKIHTNELDILSYTLL